MNDRAKESEPAFSSSFLCGETCHSTRYSVVGIQRPAARTWFGRLRTGTKQWIVSDDHLGKDFPKVYENRTEADRWWCHCEAVEDMDRISAHALSIT